MNSPRPCRELVSAFKLWLHFNFVADKLSLLMASFNVGNPIFLGSIYLYNPSK